MQQPTCSHYIRKRLPHTGAVALAASVTTRLQAALQVLRLPEQLCIKEGKSAWLVELDLYILCADGSVTDAALLAVVATLHDLQLTPVKGVADDSAALMPDAEGPEASGSGSRKLQLPCTPLSTTMCLHNQQLLVDPTQEEEAISESTIVAILDEKGVLHGGCGLLAASASGPIGTCAPVQVCTKQAAWGPLVPPFSCSASKLRD